MEVVTSARFRAQDRHTRIPLRYLQSGDREPTQALFSAYLRIFSFRDKATGT